MSLKFPILIALIVGGIFGWINSRIKRENVPVNIRKEYDLMSVLIGSIGAVFVVIAIFVLFG